MGTIDQPLPEAELIRAVTSGHTEAYGQIFQKYRDHAYGLAYQYTGNKEDALDVVQDAFIKAFLNLRRFDISRDFGPWFLKIVRNQSIDHLRKRKRTRAEDLPVVLPDRGALKKTERRVMRMDIRQGLAQLPTVQREIVFLKDYQGHSYAEIAEIQRIPLGTVMSRLHHARKKLAAYLNGKADAV